MESCPDCGLVLQTLDLPCPVCGPADGSPLRDADLLTLHKYAKSFRTRHWFRPQPNRFVAAVNRWLDCQPGLAQVSWSLQRDHHGIASGLTLTCFASSRDPGCAFRFERISLLRGRLGLRSHDVGHVLNRWADVHPDREIVSHVAFSRMHQPTECWLLSKGPRDSTPPVTVEPSARLGVWLRALFALALCVGIIILVAAAGSFTHTSQWLDGFALWAGIAGAPWMLRRRAKRQRRPPSHQ